jgi:uncharacterized protein
MIATIINAVAVVVGSIIGLLLNRRISERLKEIVYNGIGVISLVIGFSMALQMQRVLYLALSIVIGGLLGTWWGVEKGVLRFGEFLKGRFQKQGSQGEFAYGFLTASVLFCVGAMSIVGSFQAGVDGNYELILTKSVMDGTMAILLTAAMGIGVAFSAIFVLVYQGALTLLAVWLRPFVSELMLSELSAVGGAMIVMIGISMLDLKRIRTADYVPALLVVIVFVLLDPWIRF